MRLQGCRTHVQHVVQWTTLLPTCRCRVGIFFFFFSFPDMRQFAPNQADLRRFGLNRIVLATIAETIQAEIQVKFYKIKIFKKKTPKISHSLLTDCSLVFASLPLCSLTHSLSISSLSLPKNPRPLTQGLNLSIMNIMF